jgi:broad specificity phosphatase PhoE
MRRLWFITHPEIVVEPAKPVPEWSLSERGIWRMKRFCARSDIRAIRGVYSSGETKARESATILTSALSLEVTVVDSLGENDRASTGFLPPEEFQKVADSFFAEPLEAVKGWERAIDAQRRIVGAIKGIVESDKGEGDIAVISHGGVGALLMCHLLGVSISRDHEQPGTGGGNYFLIAVPAVELACGWTDIATRVN